MQLQPKLNDMAKEYMLVSQCWQNPELAVTEGMSVERAITTLARITSSSMWRPAGIHLAKRAHDLMQEIIVHQAEPVTSSDHKSTLEDHIRDSI